MTEAPKRIDRIYIPAQTAELMARGVTNLQGRDVTCVRADIAAAMEWRLIETVPKDGTPILVYNARSKGMYSSRATDSPHWNTKGDLTHWKPLPEAPDVAIAKAKSVVA